MRVETEKEFKFQLKKDDFSRLKSSIETAGYKKIEVVNQVNFYIDTEDFALRNCGITLRVRHFIDSDTFEFTAKVKRESFEEDNDLKVKDEFTVDLCREDAEKILKNNEIKKFVSLFENKSEILIKNDILDNLTVLGNLSTERTNYFINEEAMISFDKSRYLGEEDYEIELETKNIEDDRAFLNKLFEKNDVRAYEENKSKVKRFIEKLKRQ